MPCWCAPRAVHERQTYTEDAYHTPQLLVEVKGLKIQYPSPNPWKDTGHGKTVAARKGTICV
jgi:hypothetical protein